MELLTGTSGFDYAAWTGSFYPDDLAAAERLAHYSSRLRAVEINATFYRLPKRDVVRGWAERSAEDFRFVLKASRRITHFGKLAGVESAVEFLWKSAQELGPKLGPILFQLPPTFRADFGRLDAFLESLPPGLDAALEVRNPTWRKPELASTLEKHGVALVAADPEGSGEPDLLPTAPFGYLRLRREDYDEADVERWHGRIAAQPWERCYVFFKHEDGGVAPRLAEQLAGRPS